ncbi:MAG: hypothetical protein PHY45_06275 [Rhodocyclaceae bacterium]|nr:hypothetical protein [Rhodocyclaceae bacterium]
MKVFFVTALIVGMLLAYWSDPHATSAVDYNGVRALMALLIN